MSGPDNLRERLAEKFRSVAHIRTPWLQERERTDTLRARVEAARQSLIQSGYFTADEVGPDIAPRIIELHAALRDKIDRLRAQAEAKDAEIESLRRIARNDTLSVADLHRRAALHPQPGDPK